MKRDAYLPYDWRFVGAYVHMDQKERALDIFEYLMNDCRPLNWNHRAEVVWKEYELLKSMGDMLHSWAASDFIRSVRSMLVNDPPGAEVKNLPTHYGKLSYSMKKRGSRVVIDASKP